MKTILILRHAKSDWSDEGKADFERPLTRRGLVDAPRMGQVLPLFDSVPDQILASPALRARQTAELAAKACNYAKTIHWEETFYEGSSADFLAALRQLPATLQRPMLVGHNPGLEETVANLCASSAANTVPPLIIKIPTAGLVCIDVDIDNWASLEPGHGLLRWFLIPRLVKAMQA